MEKLRSGLKAYQGSCPRALFEWPEYQQQWNLLVDHAKKGDCGGCHQRAEIYKEEDEQQKEEGDQQANSRRKRGGRKHK